MKFLYKFKIWKRLYFVFGLILALTIGNLIYNLGNLDISKKLVVEMNASLLSIDYLIEADRDAYQSSIAISQALNNEDMSDEDLTATLEDIKENRDQVKERYESFSKIFNVEQSAETEKNDQEFWKNYNQMSLMTDSILHYLKQKNVPLAETIYNTAYQNAFKPMRACLNTFTDIHLASSDIAFNNSLEISENIRNNSILIFCLVVLVFAVSGYVLTRSISVPLKHTVHITERCATGDLTEQVKATGKDETSTVLQALDGMIVKISDIVGSIKSSSRDFLNSSNELSMSAQELTEGVNQQASASEEISASIEEIASSIEQNAGNAKQTELLAIQAAENIKIANQSVEQTIEAMNKILQKVNIINDIAGKTNMLAINAAIEAARAGVHGRGFAVVANEVKKLAEHSKNAAKEIDAISISSVQVAEKSGKLLATVIPDIQNTSKLIQEISVTCAEQNSSVSQISNAIQQMANVVQKNAALSEELAASSETLTAQAEHVMETVSFFKTKQDLKNTFTPKKAAFKTGIPPLVKATT